MRFANIRELKLSTNKVLNICKRNGPVIVTRRGKPIVLLRNISENDFTFSVKTLWNRLRHAAGRSGYTIADVEELVRGSRKPKK